MTDIDWSFFSGPKTRLPPPDSVKKIIDNVDTVTSILNDITLTRKKVVFLRCPAHTDFLKNVYVFKAPLDLEFEIDVLDDNNKKVWCKNLDDNVFDHIVDLRYLTAVEKGLSPYPIIGFRLLNVFKSKEPCILQVLPAFLHYNDFTLKTTVIPGEFDINNWVRPVELMFEIKNKKEQFFIKKGDALCYFKFIAQNKTTLKKKPAPWDEIETCARIVSSKRFRPLEERYAVYKNSKEPSN